MLDSVTSSLTESQFSENALRVLKERYFARHADGSLETPTEFLWRVAWAIAKADMRYGSDPLPVAHRFYDMMARRDFMPNTPCLVNAGRPLSMLSACFVLDVPDSIHEIFTAVRSMALIEKGGGGVGFAFSNIRSAGSLVASTGRDASGPISFMKVFNGATDSIKQGGVRRGALMSVLSVEHPDILEFVRCKKELDAENRALYNRIADSGSYTARQLAKIKQELLQTQFNNFNISVAITDRFIEAVRADADFDLIDPATKRPAKTVRAREIMDAIVEGAWQNGEPGVLFLDHPGVNPLPGLGPIQATNPCFTGDTLIETVDGPKPIASLVGKPFEAIVDGRPFASNAHGAWSNGVKPIGRLETEDGQVLRVTWDHQLRTANEHGIRGEWRTLRDLRVGDYLALHFHAKIPVGAGGGSQHPFATKITAIEDAGTEEVFDCSIPGPHVVDAGEGIYAHNCGEQFLHGNDACNLGSINVGHFYNPDRADGFDWERLYTTARTALHFLDNVIDENLYPLPEIEAMVKANRRVGLGIMGFADLLLKLKIPYGSRESAEFAEHLMQRIAEAAADESERLAVERGEFPNKHLSIYANDPRPRRNVAMTTIAPTGTISMIAGCSFGCEPHFGIAYTKHVMKDAEGRAQSLYYVVPEFEAVAKEGGYYDDAIFEAIANNGGSLRGIAGIPPEVEAYFTVTADVSAEDHIRMLAAFQKHVDNAVSKTINAPNSDTRENVAQSILLAHELGCKGFTYYRDGSRTEQVVTFSNASDLNGTDGATDDVDAILAKANALINT
jgi:ribonucleoside-diphosphate reductase alpha chain